MQKDSRSEARPEKMELMMRAAQKFQLLSCELLQNQNIPGLERQISSICTELPKARVNTLALTLFNKFRHRSSDGSTNEKRRRLSSAVEKLAIVLFRK